MELQDYQLRLRQYDLDTLAAHLGTLSKVKIVTTQRLTAEFCARYLLGPDDSDDDVAIWDVLKCQPHITKQALMDACQIEMKRAQDNTTTR